MDDKQIRKILIEYLQAKNYEIRIYQEKSIGSSICDVMAVTDMLTGYEIKSDLDNYARLESQVRAYNQFFDCNYLVVSDTHLSSAPEKIPPHWGILCIRNDAVSVERVAKRNPVMSRRRQLSILWKLELKNLLMKNDLPLFAQKDKGYIADRIAENVSGELLGAQIAYELLHRDYSVYDAKDYTVYSKGVEVVPVDENMIYDRNVNDFPGNEVIDALSEKDLSEFTLDKWIALYRHAMAVREKKENIFKKPVPARVPHAIQYTDIEVSPGAPWVDRAIINEFVMHLLTKDRADISLLVKAYAKNCVKYESVTGSWFIEHKPTLGDHNINAEVKFGLKRFNALFILEATLNLREIKLYDGGTVYNERDTAAALEKQKLIIREFRDWVWQDEDRRWQIEEAYNRMFAPYDRKKYDGSALSFPDMNPEYSLFPYQKDAVEKIIKTKNTLLAFDVGAGKTYIMIAAAMKMRRDGLSRKNMFVVPNHIVGQWEKIFTDLYPKAKVLAIEPKSFRPQMRQKVLKQIKEGDYDGIIIAYSCFEMIPISADAVWANMRNKLTKINMALAEKKYYVWGSAPLKQEAEYLRKLTAEFVKSMTPALDGEIYFDDLEINTLFLDEAHNYKNLPLRTKLKNLNGINIKGSGKCLDMMHKIRCVQNQNGGRGVVLATGTPLCNSISDAYAVQMYVQPEEMERTGLDVFDNWVRTFAEPEQLLEIDVDTSRFRMIRKFAKFHNLPELSAMFSQAAIFYAASDEASLPKLRGYTDTVIPRYAELDEYMRTLCDRTDEIRAGKIDRTYDNMLKVSTDGRKAALDLKLVDMHQPDGEYSKLCRCVENATALYRKHTSSTQLIFCDYSTPKGESYSVYQELKERLMSAGIPEKEIAFIHDYRTESRKLELYNKFNAGTVRILIGSTFKLGTGANVQTKLKAIHHLDVPWRPADMVQREGRMIRRGNENDDVVIYRYITEGSFDSYSWQILETKQKFISQFLSGSSYQRSVSDLENNVLTYAEVKALALAEPLMKELAEKENELKNLRIIYSKEIETKNSLREELKSINENISKLQVRYQRTLSSVNCIPEKDSDVFKSEYARLSRILTREVVKKQSALPESAALFGFKITLPEFQSDNKPYIYLERFGEKYTVYTGDSAAGNARRVINFFKNFDTTVDDTLKAVQNAENRKTDIEAELNAEDEYTVKLKKCEAEVTALKERIQSRID